MPTHSCPRGLPPGWFGPRAAVVDIFFLHKEREGEEGRAFSEKKHFFFLHSISKGGRIK